MKSDTVFYLLMTVQGVFWVCVWYGIVGPLLQEYVLGYGLGGLLLAMLLCLIGYFVTFSGTAMVIIRKIP